MYKLFIVVWNEGRVPDDWYKATISKTLKTVIEGNVKFIEINPIDTLAKYMKEF